MYYEVRSYYTLCNSSIVYNSIRLHISDATGDVLYQLSSAFLYNCKATLVSSTDLLEDWVEPVKLEPLSSSSVPKIWYSSISRPRIRPVNSEVKFSWSETVNCSQRRPNDHGHPCDCQHSYYVRARRFNVGFLSISVPAR